jgi:signal peptide peptidase SppA
VNEIWFGTESAYYQSIEALKKYDQYLAANPQHMVALRDGDEDAKSSYLSVVDNVGIVTVSGPLVDGKLGWIGAMFGITGYGDIQEALMDAVSDADVRSVLLVVKSGGGHVAGCAETAALIENVDKVKPVVTYTPTMMASAALWLGVSSRKIYAGETAIVGSIGTLMLMVSRAEQLKKDGIDARVIRSGKYKALGHPAEPISEEAIEKATAQADYLSDIFLSYVAKRRGKSKAVAKSTFGEGREFIGAQAEDIGLIDGVQSYSGAFISAKSAAPADNKTKILVASAADQEITADNAAQTEGTPMPNPHIPTPEQLAAMAAGVELPTAAQPAATTPQVVPEAAAAKLEALEASLATAVAEAEALKVQVAEAQAASAAFAAQNIELSKLADIARASIRTMTIAMGGSADSVAELKVEALAASHAEVSEKFKARYKTGNVAATAPEKPEEQPAPAAHAVNPLFAYAAALTRKS